MNDNTIAQWQGKAEISYKITVISFALLIALLLIGQFVHGFSLPKLLMQLLPLVIFIPGLIAKVHYRTYSWLCFVLLAYFTAYVVELGSPLRHWTDAVGVTLSVVMFISAMMASRYVQRWQVAEREAQA